MLSKNLHYRTPIVCTNGRGTMLRTGQTYYVDFVTEADSEGNVVKIKLRGFRYHYTADRFALPEAIADNFFA